MLKYKCPNCAGEFEIHSHGELMCPYCGSKQYFSDAELMGYKGYRDNVLQYVRASNDMLFEKGDVLRLWSDTDIKEYESAAGQQIELSFTYRTAVDGVDVFINKDSAIYVFPPEKHAFADKMVENIESLQYPSADIKGLRNTFPHLKARYELKNGGVLLAFSKSENVYPMFVFSDLHPKHVAWMISRMENICCLLEFNERDHLHMDSENLFINPKSHEVLFYGGWWDMRDDRPITALTDLRKTAVRLTGNKIDEGPAMYDEFLKSEPKATAYDDFEYWDSVIEKGFGGHHFTEFK